MWSQTKVRFWKEHSYCVIFVCETIGRRALAHLYKHCTSGKLRLWRQPKWSRKHSQLFPSLFTYFAFFTEIVNWSKTGRQSFIPFLCIFTCFFFFDLRRPSEAQRHKREQTKREKKHINAHYCWQACRKWGVGFSFPSPYFWCDQLTLHADTIETLSCLFCSDDQFLRYQMSLLDVRDAIC